MVASPRPDPAPGILIVDDDADILQGLRDYLRGYLGTVPVHVAATSAEGLAVLEREPVGVVISDYRMPGGDGVSFLAKVCARYPSVRGMLWTAFPDRDLAARAFEAGAACFATKLAPPTTLLGLVQDLMAARIPRGHASHVLVNPAWRP